MASPSGVSLIGRQGVVEHGEEEGMHAVFGVAQVRVLNELSTELSGDFSNCFNLSRHLVLRIASTLPRMPIAE